MRGSKEQKKTNKYINLRGFEFITFNSHTILIRLLIILKLKLLVIVYSYTMISKIGSYYLIWVIHTERKPIQIYHLWLQLVTIHLSIDTIGMYWSKIKPTNTYQNLKPWSIYMISQTRYVSDLTQKMVV